MALAIQKRDRVGVRITLSSYLPMKVSAQPEKMSRILCKDGTSCSPIPLFNLACLLFPPYPGQKMPEFLLHWTRFISLSKKAPPPPQYTLQHAPLSFAQAGPSPSFPCIKLILGC